MSVPVAAPPEVPFLDLTGTTDEVRDQVLEGWAGLCSRNEFVGGDAVAHFEEQWAAYCGTRHAVGVGNGTDALHLALRALGIGPGDEVIVPANTFVATVEAVLLAGAVPRFADVDPRTALLTAAEIEARTTPRTRAVVVVHLYGQLPDMDAVMACADRLGLLVVEDAAQAHGATWRGTPAGGFGAAGCFSFYPGKNLGAFGDAGAVVTSDPAVERRLRSLRDHGRRIGSHYQHERLGTNSRLDAAQAVVLTAKLGRLGDWNAARRALAERYRDRLGEGPVTPVHQLRDGRGVHHLLVVRTAGRDRVRRELAATGIGTGVHYPVPCHLVPAYRRYADGPLPEAERAAAEQLSLPMYPHLDGAVVDRVCEALLASVAGAEPCR